MYDDLSSLKAKTQGVTNAPPGAPPRPKGPFGAQINNPCNCKDHRNVNGPLDFLETDFFNEVFAKQEDGSRALQVKIGFTPRDVLYLAGALAAGFTVAQIISSLITQK
jgi:hypothetical protein